MTATGFQVFGGLIGSELLIQGPDAFQEANGGFNEGTLAPGTVLQAPFAVSATEFEFSIDRNAVGVAAPFLGLSLVTGSSIESYFGTTPVVVRTIRFNSATRLQVPLRVRLR